MKQFVRLTVLCACLSGLRAVEVDAPKSGVAPAFTNVITLEALVSDVVERNPESKFYTAEIAAAKGERRAAGTRANPEVSTELGQKRLRGGGLSDEGIAWSFSVRQPFEWPGRIPLRKAIANQQMKLADLGYAQFKSALTAKTRSLAFSLFAAQQKAAAAREVADRFHALREVLVQRDPSGLTPALELKVIESTELAIQRKATEQQLEAQTLLLQLNQLRAEPFGTAITIEEPKLNFASPPIAETLANVARTNNFELLMRRAELEQQGFKVSLAEKERFPTVSVGPFFSQERAGGTENIVGIGVSLPVPLWNRNKGNIDTAKARVQQAETSLCVTQLDVERKVAEQNIRYETKLAEMAKWRPDSIGQFREAATLADRHYRLGAVPIATYVELQKQYLEAVEALLDTKREALEAGEQLQLLTGIRFQP